MKKKPKREPWWVRPGVKRNLSEAGAALDAAESHLAANPGSHSVETVRMTIESARRVLSELATLRRVRWRSASAVLDACTRVEAAAAFGHDIGTFALLAGAHCSLGMARVLAAADEAASGARAGSRAAKLRALAAKFPELGWQELNAKLAVPMDDREARRVVKAAR